MLNVAQFVFFFAWFGTGSVRLFFHVGSDSPNFLKWWISPDVALCPAVPSCKVPQLANVRVMLVGQQKAENSVRRLRVFFSFFELESGFLGLEQLF